jgi:Uma2 family endonuclease
VRLPLTLSRSEPEPDLAVVRALEEERAERHPAGAALVVEVAEQSLERDLSLKAPLYAQAGVAHYWVVDVVARQVHVHSEPSEGRYERLRLASPPEVLTCPALPSLRVPLGDVLA